MVLESLILSWLNEFKNDKRTTNRGDISKERYVILISSIFYYRLVV